MMYEDLIEYFDLQINILKIDLEILEIKKKIEDLKNEYAK